MHAHRDPVRPHRSKRMSEPSRDLGRREDPTNETSTYPELTPWPYPERVSDSWAASAGVRRSMLGNRSRNTTPELGLRSELHARGLRFRVNVPVPTMPRRTIDIAWSGLRIAVFCDGCFWHGCPQHLSLPKTNPDYWSLKITRNTNRDRETRDRLRDLGWSVVSCWEHEPFDEAATRVEEVYAARQWASNQIARRAPLLDPS